MNARDRVISLLKADNPLELVNKMSAHEFKTMLALALKEQDKLTRHACADAVQRDVIDCLLPGSRDRTPSPASACINARTADDVVKAYQERVNE